MKKRPAETAGAAVGTIGAGAAIATHNWLALAVAAAGYVPAIVTYLRANGGIRGVVSSLWSGKR